MYVNTLITDNGDVVHATSTSKALAFKSATFAEEDVVLLDSHSSYRCWLDKLLDFSGGTGVEVMQGPLKFLIINPKEGCACTCKLVAR